MPAAALASIVAQAIVDRQENMETLKATQNPRARFESRAAVDNKRRGTRARMRKLRAAKRPSAAKPRQRNPPKRHERMQRVHLDASLRSVADDTKTTAGAS